MPLHVTSVAALLTCKADTEIEINLQEAYSRVDTCGQDGKEARLNQGEDELGCTLNEDLSMNTLVGKL